MDGGDAFVKHFENGVGLQERPGALPNVGILRGCVDAVEVLVLKAGDGVLDIVDPHDFPGLALAVEELIRDGRRPFEDQDSRGGSQEDSYNRFGLRGSGNYKLARNKEAAAACGLALEGPLERERSFER